MNVLDQLKQWTVVVADTGDYEAIVAYKPQDATTNPSLILAQAKTPAGKACLQEAIERYAPAKPQDQAWVDAVSEMCTVLCAKKLLAVIPGVVSVEVDARLSHDTAASVAYAKRFISQFEKEGISKDRILIKMATTWASCQACKALAAEGIRANMTLVFSLAQAVCAADCNAFLISPFVGRILDWHKKANPQGDFAKEKDPGVISVRNIYNYFKQHDVKTIVMAASFRLCDEITCLAGVDRVTVAPKLLQELQAKEAQLERVLGPELACSGAVERVPKLAIPDEATFNKLLAADRMASEKLAEGIDQFSRDITALHELIRAMCPQ